MKNLAIRAGLGLCLLASATALSACGSDDSGTSGTGGSSTGGSSATGGSTATGGSSATGGGGMGGTSAGTGGATGAGTCTTDPQSPNDITETQMTDTYPAPAGGALVDGVYYLSHFDVYSPAAADSHVRARTILISGNKFTSINVDDNGAAISAAGTVNTLGTSLDITFDCPNQGVNGQFPYTATGTEFWIHDTDEPNVQIYTRQ